LKIRVNNRSSSNQQLIPPFSNRCPPNNVSQAASHSITIDCFRGYSLAHHKPEAGVVESIRNRAQHQ
jgi:hypothetical protein